MGSAFIFIYALALGAIQLLWAPDWGGPMAVSRAIDWLSAGLGILLALHVFRGVAALDFLFGRKKVAGAGSPWRWLWYGMGILALVSIHPQVSRVALPILFAIHVFLFFYTRLWSIENILFQNLIFHLALARFGSWSWLFTAEQQATVELAALNSLAVSLGLLMHSAGLEKLRSAMWMAGEGTRRFFQQRHLMRPGFSSLCGMPRQLLSVASAIVMAAEFLLLPSMLFRPAAMGIIIVLLGFACSLFIVTDLSYIGQILALQLAVIAGLAYGSDIGWATREWHSLDWLNGILLGSLLLTCISVHYPAQARAWKLGWAQHFLTGINSPIRVFTEAHLVDTQIYRICLREPSSGSEVPVSQVFDLRGGPGALQFWSPRYLQSAMYLIGRVIARSPDASAIREEDDQLLRDLISSLLRGQDGQQGEVDFLVSPACLLPDGQPDWHLFKTYQIAALHTP